MANQFERPDSSTGQGLLWLFGVILVIQGFGSAVTEAGWDTSFWRCGPHASSPYARVDNPPGWLRGVGPAGNCGPPSPREEAVGPSSVKGPQANRRAEMLAMWLV
ncbi:hypothetical protein GCM10020256_13650 [Streptomyces thermocoprophilus]